MLAGQLATGPLGKCGRQEAGEVHISGSQTERHCNKGETYDADQRDSNFTDLLDDALYCAIVPCRDDPAVSPPGIKDTTNCLQKVEYKKRNLS